MNKSSNKSMKSIDEAAQAAGLTNDASASVRFWIADQLMAHEYAKLTQGGHTNTQVPLRRVFVDLPIQIQNDEDERAGFLDRLVSSPPLSLQNDEIFFYERHSASADEASKRKNNSIVRRTRTTVHGTDSLGSAVLLIGGPGQGKSTVSQLACQLHRALLLRDAGNDLTVAQSEVVRSFLSDTGRNDNRSALKIPAHPLLPLQIPLPDLMAWANKPATSFDGSHPVLLEFISQLPSATRVSLNTKTILAIAKQLGCLVVLDGFDEIGSVEDRSFIVRAAQELLDVFRKNEIQIQIVVTTRPQGYSGEMERIGLRFQEQTLVPLTNDEALSYANKLISAKIAGADQRHSMLQRMQEAAAEPATQRLLTTPLQVTILTALVQQLGRAPRERWNLFSRYFSYTYDREIERNTYASSLLADHRSHVEQIHARIALILQVESEKHGGGAARLSKSRLEEVILTVLAEEEIPLDRRNQLARDISKAAEERLVFLVEPEPGKFGFEIRSLQEFMAANALTTGRDVAVEARLKQISRAAMFRNTTLFCASRFFSEASPLRDIFEQEICPHLDRDSSDPASELTKSGALLALETLEEGAVLTQPKRAKLLMGRALGLLSLPPNSEHIRLIHASNEDTESVLEISIRQHFLFSAGQRRYNNNSIWLALIEGQNKGYGWAEAIADRHFDEFDFTGDFFREASRVSLVISHWFSEKLSARNDKFLPIAFLERSFLVNRVGTPPSWLGYLSTLLGPQAVWGLHRAKVHGQIPSLIRDKPKNIRPTTPPPAAWLAWIAAADFESTPTKDTLAQALRAIAHLSEKEITVLIERTSWPLACSLIYYQSTEELRDHAKKVEAGDCGDTSDWLRLEDLWTEENPQVREAIRTASSPPLDFTSLSSTPPFLAISLWVYLESGELFGPKAKKTYELASEEFKKATNPRVKRALAQICLGCLRGLPSRISRANYLPFEWIQYAPDFSNALIPRPSLMKKEEWIKLLNAHKSDLSVAWLSDYAKTKQSMVESNCHPAVVRTAIELIQVYSEHNIGREGIPFHPFDGLEEVIRGIESSDRGDASYRANIALIRLVAGQCDEKEDEMLLQILIKAAKKDAAFCRTAISGLALTHLSDARGERAMCLFYSALGPSCLGASQGIRFLRSQLQKRVSNLEVPNIWDRLTLPLPRPNKLDEAGSKAAASLLPVHIKSLELKDLGGINQIKFDFSTPDSANGQWIVILGKNGVGKTTILRSLAISLRNLRDPSIWPRGAFGIQWIRVPKITGDPIGEASICVDLGERGLHETVIRDGETTSFSQQPEQSEPSLFPIFAYGCRRGSALGGGTRAVDLGEGDGPGVATLFDDGANLVHAETWLVKLEGDAIKNRRSALILRCIFDSMKHLLSLEEISVRDQKLWVKQAGKPELPLNALSDGYLTAAGWFLDLIARWVEHVSEADLELDEKFLEKMNGLVLIDEIDLHLHPRWQIEIISRTRKLLPRMTFVVTTHNPLTLVGAQAEEIWILDEDGENIKATAGLEQPVLLSGGQLYRRYFGIDDIYPDAVGRATQRYGFLTSITSKTKNELEEMAELEVTLKNAGLLPNWSSEGTSNPMDLIN